MSRGGKRQGAGRKPGSINKATHEIKEAAREYSADALKRLVHLMSKAQSESAQVAACKEILDRAWGKSTQVLGGDADNPIETLQRVEIHVVDSESERPTRVYATSQTRPI